MQLFHTCIDFSKFHILGLLNCRMTCGAFCCLSSFLQLIRKDGDYHSSRLLDGKDIQANQNMQPKKKHKKSSHKVKEKVEVETVRALSLFFLNKCKRLEMILIGSCCLKHILPPMDMDDDLSLKVQKNFICDHCYGAFRSSYHLKRHILTHTGENWFLMFSVSNHVFISWRCISHHGRKTSLPLLFLLILFILQPIIDCLFWGCEM